MQSKDQNHQDKHQQIIKLANITIKELSFLEQLITKISENKTKYIEFERLAVNLEIIKSEERKIANNLTKIHEVNEKSLTSSIKKAFPLLIKNENENETSILKETELALGKTRYFIYKTVLDSHQVLLSTLKENFQAIKLAQIDIKEEIKKQSALGIPMQQLKDINAEKNKLPNLKISHLNSITSMLKNILIEFEREQKFISSTIQFNQNSNFEKIASYYQSLLKIIDKFLEIIDLVNLYYPKDIIKLLYNRAPWLNPNLESRNMKFEKILKGKEAWVYTMTDMNPLLEEKIKETVYRQHKEITTYDEFQLNEAYHSDQKSRHEFPFELDSPSTSSVFNENHIKYKKQIITILDKFNSSNQSKKDEAATEAICFLYSLTRVQKSNLHLLIPTDYEKLIQKMTHEYPEISNARLSGLLPEDYEKIIQKMTLEYPEILNALRLDLLQDNAVRLDLQPKDYEKLIQKMTLEYPEILNALRSDSENVIEKTKESPFSTQIYVILKDFLNQPKVDLKQVHQIHPLINTVWKIYFKHKRSSSAEENIASDIETIQLAINNCIKPDFIPDSKTSEFIKKLRTLSLTCKTLNRLANEEVVWKPIYRTKSGQASAKTTFAEQVNNLKLLDTYHEIRKEFYDKVLYNDAHSVHLHDFKFKIDKGQIISDIITKQSPTSFRKLLAEYEDQTGPVYFRLIGSGASYRVKIIAIDQEKMEEIVKDLQKTLNSDQPKTLIQ